MRVSIVVPILNERGELSSLLPHLMNLRGDIELILADGGSHDGSLEYAKEKTAGHPRFSVVECSATGRAHQMNAGARLATGDTIVFLHCDCRLGDTAVEAIERAMQKPSIVGGGFLKKYDRENVGLILYRVVVNLIRSKMLKNLVGTNAMFVRRKVFEALEGFPIVPILEDVVFCDRLKKEGQLAILTPHVVASSRRYRSSGSLRRIWVSFKIIAMHRLGFGSLERLNSVYANAVGKRPDEA